MDREHFAVGRCFSGQGLMMIKQVKWARMAEEFREDEKNSSKSQDYRQDYRHHGCEK